MYMGVRKIGPFIYQYQKIGPFIYFLFLKKGVYHIPGGAEKGEGLFGTHIRTMSYIGSYPSTRDLSLAAYR